jgi:hypothetical protein
MPGGILVSEVFEPSFSISTAGNTLTVSTTNGNIASYDIYCVNGGWNGASLSIKKLVSGAARAFGAPVTVTADAMDDTLAVDGVSGLVLTVDTASGTASSYVSVRLRVTGDPQLTTGGIGGAATISGLRISGDKYTGGGIAGATDGSGDFSSPPPGGGSLFP